MAVTEPVGERRVALVCHTWGHQSTLFAWVFAKQYILRRQEQDGKMVLDPREKLFIVKAGRDEGGPDRWKVGGPLVPDLDTALQRYPHTTVKLEGSVKSNIHTFLAQHDIDLLLMPSDWPKSLLPGFVSVSQWVKQNVRCPFIIVRRNAVVNARMQISSQVPQHGGDSGGRSPQASFDRTHSMGLPLTPQRAGRRIAIAYNTFPAGRGLMQFAREKVLTHADTVYICHVFPPQHNAVVKDAIKFMRVMTLQRADSFSEEVTRDNSIQFGAAELAGYNVHLNVTLQGDSKSALASFCESEEVELLIIGSRSTGMIRKKFGGGGVSSHLIDNAPCPCLVVPYKYMGVDDGPTGDEELSGSPTSPPGAAWPGGGSSPTAASAAEAGAGGAEGLADAAVQTEGPGAAPRAASVAASLAAGGSGHSTPSDLLTSLQKQLEEKDRTIVELRQEVQQLRLAAAEREASSSRDPTQAAHAV